jgi:hypothetical protein
MDILRSHALIRYYCMRENIEVIKSNMWSFDHNERLITEVWRSKPTKTWLYSILHELGHMMNRFDDSFSERNWKIHELGVNKPVDKIASFQIMKDEIEAWDRGYKIALELNIDIDKIEYDTIASYYLFEYIKWIPCEYDYLRSN